MRGAGPFIVFAALGAVGVVGFSAALTNRVWAAPAFHPKTRVVLFTPSNADPLVARIEAELATLGIAVRRLETPPDSQLDSVITREIAGGASAAIRVIPRSRGTEVWTGDTTARVLRRRSIRGDTSDAALSVIALRTVEFLRASLLDVKRPESANRPAARTPNDQSPVRETPISEKTMGTERQAPIEKVPSTEKIATVVIPMADTPAARPAETPLVRPQETTAIRRVEAPAVPLPETHLDPSTETPAVVSVGAPSEAPRSVGNQSNSSPFEITAGPALLASPGGIAPMVSAAVLGRGRIAGRAGIELMAVFPIVPAHLTNPEGSVQISTALFGAAATFRLTPPGRWTSDAALGVSVMMLRSAGSAMGTVGDNPPIPNGGTVVSARKPVGHIRVGAGVAITHWLALRADVIAGLMTSHIGISYMVRDNTGTVRIDRDRATWGPAFAAGALSFQANW